MAEQMEPTKALVAFLADVDNRKVATADDFAVHLQVAGEPDAIVTEMAGAVERAGWAYEPAQCRVWELTGRGREVLDEGVPGDLIDELEATDV